MIQILRWATLMTIGLSMTACGKKEEPRNISEALYFAENIKPIKDSIVKSKFYNTQLIVCSLKKLCGFNMVTLAYPSIPYLINSSYDYRSIEGVNVLFIDYNDTVIDRRKKEEIQHLINSNVVTLEGRVQNLDPPFLRFIFCQDNYNNITCYDNIMQDSLDRKCLEEGKTYNEMMFYPKCSTSSNGDPEMAESLE